MLQNTSGYSFYRFWVIKIKLTGGGVTTHPFPTHTHTPRLGLTGNSDNYSQTFGSLWHYDRDEPFLDANDNIADFPADNNNCSPFKFKTKMAGRAGNDGTKNIKNRVALN